MQLRSQITDFKQEDREPLALVWDRMKEAIRNCPNHGMEEWLILHMFYNALRPMSKTMLDTAAGGTIMGRPIEEAHQLLDNMQENHAQWHLERSTTRKVKKITMARNLGRFATLKNSFMREPIAQPDVVAVEYEIKLNLISMVQQDQFGGSTSEDTGMHLHNFPELCNMTRIWDYDPDALKLHLFPFSLKGKSK
jgi:hypothetical protein